MATPTQQQQPSPHISCIVERKNGCRLQAFDLPLYQEWARRYQAIRTGDIGLLFAHVDGKLQQVMVPLIVFFVPVDQERYPEAVAEARAIYQLHRTASTPQAYTHYRQFLTEASYSSEQLDSVPRPEEIAVLHLSAGCLGQIHRGHLPGNGDPYIRYFCTSCHWISPSDLACTSADLLDLGVLMMPIDAYHQLPCATDYLWGRRVLLHQKKLITLTEAAQYLNLERELLVSVSQTGAYQSFEHPDDLPQEWVFYRHEVEEQACIHHRGR